MNAKTSSVNLPPQIDADISDAIEKAWKAGEINIFHDSTYAGQFPKPGHEWWRIDWVTKKTVDGQVTDSVMYAGAFEMKTLFRQQELKSNDDKINGFLLFQLTLDFQRDKNKKMKLN